MHLRALGRPWPYVFLVLVAAAASAILVAPGTTGADSCFKTIARAEPYLHP